MPINRKQLRNAATIVPQMSKCLKFEVIQDDKGFVFERKDIVRLGCIVDQRMTHHNHLIHLNYDRLSFVKLR